MDDTRIEYEFDLIHFTADIANAIRDPETPAQPITVRMEETATGISASTFSRMDNGKQPDMETFIQICSRLDLEPGKYFKRYEWRRVEG